MGDSNKGGGVELLLVIPGNKTRGSGHKVASEVEVGIRGKKFPEREVQHWKRLLRVALCHWSFFQMWLGNVTGDVMRL